MTTALHNLSHFEFEGLHNPDRIRVGIVFAEWNPRIIGALTEGAIDTLKKYGIQESNIVLQPVPGSFELVLGADLVTQYQNVDAVICIGCLIKGDTPHFEYISEAVSSGIMQLNIKYSMPFIFGVLTTLNEQQALDRAGGIHGNKGAEAAVAALKMIKIKER
jgi:6,7-dimethyl-8-ribityllumazine synthase